MELGGGRVYDEIGATEDTVSDDTGAKEDSGYDDTGAKEDSVCDDTGLRTTICTTRPCVMTIACATI